MGGVAPHGAEVGGKAMLTGVACAAAIVAVAYSVWFVGRQGTPWAGTVVKTAAVLLLVLLGVLQGAPGWIVAGLGLGALGDLALSRPGQRAFLVGMAAFAAGHLAYAAAFWLRGVAVVADGGGDWAGLWVLAPVVVIIALTEVWLAPHTAALRWPVRAYVGVIGVMAGVVALVPGHSGLAVVQVGAALFVVSDVLLAVRMFRVTYAGRAAVLAHLVWPTYWVGQALIVLGSLFYWAPKG